MSGPRSSKLWFKVAAFAITIAALLAIGALAMRVFMARPHPGNGMAIATSIFTPFFCVFVAIAVNRRRIRRDPGTMSIQDELDLRKRRAKGGRVPFR
jgi:hypothetical protein